MSASPPDWTGLLAALRDDALARLDAGALVAGALGAAPPGGPVRVLAAGKAAAVMMEGALVALGARTRDALCIAPHDARRVPGAHLVTGGHPRPDEGSLAAGRATLAWADGAAGADVLVLVSGGASSLLAAPALGLTLDDKARTAEAVMASGADITSLNAVRKHLSRVKGGRLALRLAEAGARAARVLVLSDVPGDDPSVVGSGPLAADPTTWDDVAHALSPPAVAARVPPAVHALVARRAEETPKPGDPRLAFVAHEILAGPMELSRAAADAARARGLSAEADPVPLVGDVRDVAARVAAWVRRGGPGPGPRVLALAGEPTVAIPVGAPAPDGGRAQHLALLCALALDGTDAAVSCTGSDGRDGPTEHAGAVVDGQTASRARASGVDLHAALAAARSGPACRALGVAVPRHPARTHLADLVLVVVGAR